MSHNSKQRPAKGSGRTSSSADPRFSNIQTDPRYRLPSRKNTHVKLDKRFAHMLRDDDFSKKASVDRYGRKIAKGEGKKELQRLYDVDDDEDVEDENTEDVEIDDDEEVRKELARIDQKYDPARQGGFSESESDEDDGSELSEADEEGDLGEAEIGDAHGLGAEEEEIPMGDVSSRIAIVNMDWDNIRAADLMAVAVSFAPPGGSVLKVSVYPSEFGRERMEREDLEGPPSELFVVKKGGNGNKSSEVADDSDSDEESESEVDSDERITSDLLAKSTADGAEVEPHALRAYQLSRLRYFYGVITCDSSNTASTLYNAMDGREYLSSANFFDMRFIPDSVTFDDPVTDKPRDECDRIPDGYRPKEFVTEALTHSKVRLTWDEDDAERKEVQKRAFSRQEVDENDLKAYVGSDSEEEDDDAENAESSTLSTAKNKATVARDKLRAALGLPVDSGPSSKPNASKREGKSDPTPAPVGDMQITFTAGLSSEAARSSVFENRPEDVKEETTRERYVRKEKERKARRKAKAKAMRDGVSLNEESASDVDVNEDEDPPGKSLNTQDIANVGADVDEEDPFNDPFFTNPAAANEAAKKAVKKAKKAASAEEAALLAMRKQREREELELLMAGETGDGVSGGKGFDMAEIRKAEKEERKRGSKKSPKQKQKNAHKATGEGNDQAGGDDFEIDVQDPRFRGVFESHEFAIDPSNPRYSGTKGMKKLLEEGRKNRSSGRDLPTEKGSSGKHHDGKRKKESMPDDLEELVNKVKKRKAA